MACYTWCWNGLLLDIMLVQQMKKLLAQWSCWVHPGSLMSETIHDHRQFVCVSLILRICCPLRVLRLSDFLYWCLPQQPADATWLSVIVGNVRFVGGLTPTGWRWPPHWWLKIVVWGSASTPQPRSSKTNITCRWDRITVASYLYCFSISLWQRLYPAFEICD